MGQRFASDKRAIAECDICGFRYKLKELRNLIVKERDTNVKACPECWDPDHPQLKLGMYPVDDPQAIRNPRPDFTGYAQSRAQIVPAFQAVGTGFIGQVTVTTG
jgi:hypothetical protein